MPGAAAVAPDGESGPLSFRARVVRPDGTCNLERAGWLDPYTVETIAADALRSGTRLEVTLPGNASHAGLTTVRTRLAWLGTRGIDVWVRRDPHLAALAAPVHSGTSGCTSYRRWRSTT